MARYRPIHFSLAKPSTWDKENMDQLVQMEVEAPDGTIHRYFLFWHRPCSMVLLEVERRQEWHWSCGLQTLAQLIRYFQGGLEDKRTFKVTNVQAIHGDVDANTILDIPYMGIKKQNKGVSVDCNW